MLSQFSYSHVSVVIVVPLKTSCLDDCIDWNKLVLTLCGSVEFVFNCSLFATYKKLFSTSCHHLLKRLETE